MEQSSVALRVKRLLQLAILLSSCSVQAVGNSDTKGGQPTSKEKAIDTSGYAFGYAKGQTSVLCKLIKDDLISTKRADAYIQNFLKKLQSSSSKMNDPFIISRIKKGIESSAKGLDCPIRLKQTNHKKGTRLL